MSIRVLKPGLSTTVQDGGRFGYAHLGISPGGAADRLSLRIANRLVGNHEYAPALEMTLMGATLEFESSATIALAGATCESVLQGNTVSAFLAIEVAAGSILRCGSAIQGVRIYLAVRGGIDVPLVLGSASTDIRGKFGGVEGRRLRAGDLLKIGPKALSKPKRLRAETYAGLCSEGPIRLTRGPQYEWFDATEYARFFSSSYVVNDQSDRAGLRLRGGPIRALEQRQLLTDGIPLGAIQIPPDGQPIVLFVDQQTTGGYPKIANVIAADMHRVGQLRPREEVHFSEATIDEAIQTLRQQEQLLNRCFDS